MINFDVLKLTEFESIKITTEGSISFNKLDLCCGEALAYFIHDKNQQFCIGEKTAGVFFNMLITRLDKAINNKLFLDQSLIQDLGVMYNEYCDQLPDITSNFLMIPTKSKETTYWIGLDYKIWSTYNTTSPALSTWLYNDEKGNIVLKITKDYPWLFLPDDLNDPDFITYDHFMKSYKPLFTRIIVKNVAEQWLKQSELILKMIQENVKK